MDCLFDAGSNLKKHTQYNILLKKKLLVGSCSSIFCSDRSNGRDCGANIIIVASISIHGCCISSSNKITYCWPTALLLFVTFLWWLLLFLFALFRCCVFGLLLAWRLARHHGTLLLIFPKLQTRVSVTPEQVFLGVPICLRERQPSKRLLVLRFMEPVAEFAKMGLAFSVACIQSHQKRTESTYKSKNNRSIILVSAKQTSLVCLWWKADTRYRRSLPKPNRWSGRKRRAPSWVCCWRQQRRPTTVMAIKSRKMLWMDWNVFPSLRSRVRNKQCGVVFVVLVEHLHFPVLQIINLQT